MALIAAFLTALLAAVLDAVFGPMLAVVFNFASASAYPDSPLRGRFTAAPRIVGAAALKRVAAALRTRGEGITL
eukprot:4447287-Pleurochrysis_carterae.AAC.1